MFYATICVGGQLACVNLKKFWNNTKETETILLGVETRGKNWTDQGLEWEGNYSLFTFFILTNF